MRNLSRVLGLKIVVTTVLWFVPLLFFPSDLLRTVGFPDMAPLIFIKLLGMAYGALLVGYVFGFIAVCHGSYPHSTVWMGILSNGGAALLLSIGAFQGSWATWGFWARFIMWLSLAATGLISAALIAFGPCRRCSPFGQRSEI
jgi:hypothetical protein